MEPPISNTKVIIAEDHLLFADGVEQILATLPGFEVIAKVGNGKLLMQILNRLIPDLVLLDINMPFMDGIEVAQLIKKNLPTVKIIFLSMYYDSRIIATARQCGVNGFFSKTIIAPELKDALQRVVAGENVFLIAEKQPLKTFDKEEDGFSRQFKLSPRETEIVQLIKKGNTTKEISGALGLSSLTVETHRKNIFRKLQVKNVAELIAFMNQQGR